MLGFESRDNATEALGLRTVEFFNPKLCAAEIFLFGLIYPFQFSQSNVVVDTTKQGGQKSNDIALSRFMNVFFERAFFLADVGRYPHSTSDKPSVTPSPTLTDLRR